VREVTGGERGRDVPSTRSGGADCLEVASGTSARVPGCWDERLWGTASRREMRAAPLSPAAERRRSPGDAHAKLEVRLGLAEDVLVGHRLGSSSQAAALRGRDRRVSDEQDDSRNVRSGLHCRRRCSPSRWPQWVGTCRLRSAGQQQQRVGKRTAPGRRLAAVGRCRPKRATRGPVVPGRHRRESRRRGIDPPDITSAAATLRSLRACGAAYRCRHCSGHRAPIQSQL
jgi:hypothetical protein